MNELIYYMVGNLKHNDHSIQAIKKKLKTQAAFNRNVAATYAALFMLICVIELESKERDTKIKKLSEEVEELKRTKGE